MHLNIIREIRFERIRIELKFEYEGEIKVLPCYHPSRPINTPIKIAYHPKYNKVVVIEDIENT